MISKHAPPVNGQWQGTHEAEIGGRASRWFGAHHLGWLAIYRFFTFAKKGVMPGATLRSGPTLPPEPT
ncbi:MAG: hypothetical protein EXS36_09615 [Pedosphaera sp.]|nr:hypothetical protein [Pedosphaera sp.]